ncbi:MAG: hypothetical protein ACK5AZ_15845 [Bryobacteraceae bacterium]
MTKFKYTFSLALLVTTAVVGASHAAAQITTFEIAGGKDVYPTTINIDGVVAGYYVDPGGNSRGFLRDAVGNITTFEAPGFSSGFVTTVWGVNIEGAVVGGGYVVGLAAKGFVRNADGSIEAIDVPGSGVVTAQSINDGGAVTGVWTDASYITHGFLRSAAGAITIFDAPGATSTRPRSINNRGEIAGTCWIGSVQRAFLRDAKGHFTIFDLPNSLGAQSMSVNQRGAVVGFFNAGGSFRGFLRARTGEIVELNVAPQSTFGTFPQTIRSNGTVAGYFFDTGNVARGFVRNQRGVVSTFDAPGASATFVNAANDDGVVAGSYIDASTGSSRGFVRQ